MDAINIKVEIETNTENVAIYNSQSVCCSFDEKIYKIYKQIYT
jgi:hypothetical protein